MNQNLPNPMRDALARQAPPDTHPSPDLLTAFVEHVLSESENHRVIDHLARCAECREIVFLAGSATEEAVDEKQDRLRAAAVPRVSPALLAKAHATQTMASASLAKVPRRRWSPRLVWSATVAAAVLLVSGVVVRQLFFAVHPTSQPASKVASNAPAPPSTERQQAVLAQPTRGSAALSLTYENKTKPARAKSNLRKDFDAVGMVPEPSAVAEKHSAVPITSGNAATQASATIAIGGPTTSAAPAAPRINSLAESEARGTSVGGVATARDYVTPQIAMRGVSVNHPLWRITAEGHLEHFVGNGWIRLLADQTTAFRAVAVLRDEVWVGGNGGALFHSSDKGQQWGRLLVVTSSGAVTASIVSIHFDDPQNGVVTTESGSRYSTNDGGITWTNR